jgi:hypothetical protein
MTVVNNSATINIAMGRNNRQVVEAMAIEWRNGIIETLTGNRTGKKYKVGKGTWYTASAQGEAPASRTGKLRNSYRARVISDTESEVGSPLDYSYYLEKGTRHMTPRPHIIVGFYKKKKEIERAMLKIGDF